MASSTHVDSRVSERRLRPIYDWLDSGNNKKALQEAEKVLKKQPNFLCAKVLKALALQRLGKEAESEDILENVCSQVPTDDATLQAITVCYRGIHKPDKVCEIYTAAAKKDPTNEELLTHLFMSYVRVGDYRKQHQHALTLYKLKPKNPYYFWAVMSLVMQAKGDDPVGGSLALKLAEKMVSKFVSEGKIEAEQEVQLYLMILEMQGKYEEALQVIEGELGEKLKSYVPAPVKKIELFIKLERWKEANILLKKHIEYNLDSWSDYRCYIETTLKLYDIHLQSGSSNNVDCAETADFTPQMANQFLLKMIDKVQSNIRRPRSPYLARLEFYKILSDCYSLTVNPSDIFGEMTELLVNYFSLFGDKPVCILDLKSYLPLLPLDQTSIFMKRISDIVGLEDGESPNSLIAIQKHISRLLFSRALGFHKLLTVDERLMFCELLLSHYEFGKQFISENKLPTDFAENDPYIIVTSHVLYSIYQDTGHSVHVRRAIFHLEQALQQSPSNFHFKLLLVKFYLLLGAGLEAFRYHELLDIKHIQLDTMGFVFVNHVYKLGNYSVASTVYDATLKFYTSNINDCVDHLTYSYKYGSFMKIEDFINFRNKLNNSLQYPLITCEKLLLDTLHSCESEYETIVKNVDQLDAIDWELLNDNRDLNIFLSYDNNLTGESAQESFKQLTYYLQLRLHLLKCLSHSFVSSFVKDLTSYYNFLNTLQIGHNLTDAINMPLPTKLYTFLKLPLQEILEIISNIITQLESKEENDFNNCLLRISTLMKNTMNTLVVEIKMRNGDFYSRRYEILEQITNVVEMMAIMIFACNIIKRKLKPSQSNKKNRKKREEVRFKEEFSNFVSQVESCLKELDESLSYFVIHKSDDDLVQFVIHEMKALKVASSGAPTFTPKDLAGIDEKLNASYSYSIQQIRDLLQEKLNTVQSFKM